MADTAPISTPRYPSPASIPGRFAQVASQHAKRVAVSTPDTQWTYEELDQRSEVVARQILDRVGAASEPIALLMQHEAPLVAAILGVLKAGKIYLALDPTEPAARLAAKVRDAQAPLLLTDKPSAALAHSLPAGRWQIVESMDSSPIGSATLLPAEVPAEAGAWLMFTSGSTGVPKGVWQNHRGVLHHTDVFCELIQVTPDDRLSLLTSCSLAASATALFAALLNGATLCPFDVHAQGVERLALWLQQQHITLYHSVPTVFRHLMRRSGSGRRFESVRLIRLGGEPVLRSDVEASRRHCPAACRLMHALSSTETGLISAWMIDRDTALPDGRIPAGQAVRGVEVQLLDTRGQPVSPGSVGRIAVRSAHLAQGYWLQPDATAEAFQTDVQNPRDRVFFTGDLGRFQADGCLQHMGRADEQVKIRGQRVDLAEVEAALQATDLFEEAAAAAQEDPSGEQRLVAYVVPRAGAGAKPQAWRRALLPSLPGHMVPGEFVPLTRLPQSPGGKVDRLALPPLSHRLKEPARPGPRPRDGIERKLARIWESVLEVPRIGRREDFFDLGGTSLESAIVLGLIDETFSVLLPPSTLVEHSTIEELAVLVADDALIPSPSPLVRLRAAPTGRPLFLIHSGQGDVATYGLLVRRLPDRPIYGLQSIGLHGECWPLMKIPDMARRYLPEVIATDPTGPYLLGGTCMGGLVAFEMARQLVQRGRPVGLVALLDSPAPPFSGRRSRWHERVLDPLRDTSRILRWAAVRAVGAGRSARWLPGYRRFLAGMNGRAPFTYRPGVYPGRITLIVTADTRYAREDRRPLMSRHARETRTITVPGTREGLFIHPTVDELARQLSICLDEVQHATQP